VKSDAWRNQLASNLLPFKDARTVTQTDPNHLKYVYRPDLIQTYKKAILIQTDGTILEKAAIELGKLFPDLTKLAVEPVPTEGILVLINFQPEVSIQDPGCDTRQLTYRCTAAEGHTIQTCQLTTNDSTLTFTQAQLVGPENRESVGTVTLPNDQAVHTFNVTATDDAGKVVTGEFTVDQNSCPPPPTPTPPPTPSPTPPPGGGTTPTPTPPPGGGTTPTPSEGACNAKPISKEALGRQPFILCPFENDETLRMQFAGQQVTWTQEAGSQHLGNSLVQEGQCLTGTFPIVFEDVKLDFTYSVEGDGPKGCVASITSPKATLEGSGTHRLFSCALSSTSHDDAKVSSQIGLAGMMVALALFFLTISLSSKKRKRPKEN
jgi:hypothetical protein